MAGFVERMIGAATLNVATYEEVETDKTATGQALAVVVLSSIAAGIGGIGQARYVGFLGGAIAALLGWLIWAFLIYFIGAKLLPEPQTRSDIGELLRTIGFSSSPGLLRVLGMIPVLGRLIIFVTAVWMLVAMIIAVRQALDYRSTWRAIGVSFLGWLVYVFVFGMLVSLFGVRPVS